MRELRKKETQKDFPDDMITIKNYKEPLKKIPKSKGVGWFGTLACTIDGEYVQCHVCGKFLASLPGHIYQSHKIKIAEYRERYELSPSTSLVAETERLRMRQEGLRSWAKMTVEQREHFRKKADKARQEGKMAHGKTITLETKNKRGTCPDQLLETIKRCAKEIGHTPSKKEFIDFHKSQRFVHLIYKTFGNWPNAIKMAKLQPKKYESPNNYRVYSDDELLEYLTIFADENNRLPTFTDFKRDYLPSYDIYIRRFGSIKRARVAAGIAMRFDQPTRWKTN